MPYYRRKHEVEARRFVYGKFKDVAKWCDGKLIMEGKTEDHRTTNRVAFLAIGSPATGWVRAYPGDWVVRDTATGKCMVHTDAVFERLFEPVTRYPEPLT